MCFDKLLKLSSHLIITLLIRAVDLNSRDLNINLEIMDAKNTLDFSTEGRIQHGGSCPYHNQKISECPICSEV